VLDEIHLFDATPRGDHLRCLLRRIDHIRAYRGLEVGDQVTLPLQRIALSATVPDPTALAHRYLMDAEPKSAEPSASPAVVQIAGVRQVVGRWQRMANLHDLIAVLHAQMSGPSQLHKTLVFCNARHEVEQIAAFLRQHLPFEATVFVHYSNLDAALRREVEEGLAQAAVAICVCTSTLELGIDIGSIDLVILVGPPPSPAAFVQRIGRAGRRRRKARVVGMARSPLEEMRFQALFHIAEMGVLGIDHGTNLQREQPFCLSVLIQQIFSILKQSPTGGIRLADLRRVTPNSVETQTLQLIFNHLVTIHYLTLGRAGEWRAGVVLQELVDAHEIYSNIGGAPQPVVVVDAYTGRAIAQTERLRAPGETLFIGGRRMEVLWRAQYRLGVRVLAATPARNDAAAAELHSPPSPFAVSLTVSQTVATLLGFTNGEMALLQAEEGIWLFHFWGDVYGELLAQLLRADLAAGATSQDEPEPLAVIRGNEHCLQLVTPTTQLPTWNAQKSRQQLHRLLPRLEPFLELGRFHTLLPSALAIETMIAQVDLPCFEQIYRSATIIHPTTDQRKQLLRLVR
jgi:replicative superfamily II helicase